MPETLRGSRIRSAVIAPGPALRPYVRRFMVIESLADRASTLLPEPGMISSIRFRGESSRDGSNPLRAVVTGLRDTPRRLRHTAGSATIVAMFTALGAAAFVREPLEDLFNTTMALDLQVRPSQLQLVEEQLAEAASHGDRVQIYERFLLEHVRGEEPDPMVAMTIHRIHSSRGATRIDDLAREAGLSQSAFERRFRRYVGATPKKFSAIVRLRHAVNLHRRGASFTQVAHEAGYSDQSHFIHDFKRFSGVAPETYFQSPESFC
jgi:AraC-like DNA-binding protein